ncbi:ABC transporter substrate-binding protein [Rhodovastum atsumiense]|nr:ABC transporter substrate-binding protein [Rhodovastum atsumiense]CAH2601723.1 ABC transporter substrate-binding protein [Rhodovastum atsumiense]
MSGDEPAFPEEEGGPRRRLDYFGHVFPPLRRMVRQHLHEGFERERRRSGLTAAWYVPASLDSPDCAWVHETEDADWLPGLLSDAGLGRFTRPGFTTRWQQAGLYQPRPQPALRPDLAAAGLADPLGVCEVYGAGPWVILADRARLRGRPVPQGWEDLLSPQYRGDIVANGSDGRLAGVLLFNLFVDFGLDGLQALGANMWGFRGGAQMARNLGSGDPEGAALAILPYFWALNNIHRDRVALVWPREGAYAVPLLLLRRHDAPPAARLAHALLTGRDWAGRMESAGCASNRDDSGGAPLPGPLRWLGWSHARGLDFPGLHPLCDAALARGALGMDLKR